VSGIIRIGWMERNARRSFPLEEAATKLSDAGERLPDDVLVSARLAVAAAGGSRICLAGLSLQPAAVSAVFVVTDAAMTATSASPLCAVTVSRPVVPFKPYPVKAFIPGVGGWLSFGRGVNERRGQWRFSDPAAAPLIPSQGSILRSLPIPAVTQPYTSGRLTGLVTLLGRGDLIIEAANRGSRRVIVFRLDLKKNPYALRDYAGPCSRRPENGDCGFPGITAINEVVPDASGNIDIVADEPALITSRPGRIAIDFNKSLLEACEEKKRMLSPTPDGTIPNAAGDWCEEHLKWRSVPTP